MDQAGDRPGREQRDPEVRTPAGAYAMARAGGKDGSTYSRLEITEANTTKEVMPRPKSTRDGW
jgi:hypothetical protein